MEVHLLADDLELRLILAHVQQMSDEHWHVLERPRRIMADKAWVGPSATSFDHELGAENRALQAQLRKAIDLIRQELQAIGGTPWRMVG